MKDKRQEIIGVATRLFSAHGFGGVSVRDICARAKVSVAMVNYHFKSKEGLYRECVERLFRKSGGEGVAALIAGVKDAASWRAAVRTWVEGFARAMHSSEGDGSLAGGIYRQEVVKPSSMHEFILKHYALPVRDSLLALMRMAGLNESDAYRWTACIWAQVSAHAIVNVKWRKMFRPQNVDTEAWSADFVEFICAKIFKELKFKKTKGKTK